MLVDPGVSAAQVVVPTAIPNLSLIPSNKSMADFPLRVAQDPEHDRLLARKIDALTGYDLVLFDSPPSMGLVTTNIFLAAREIVVPVALTYLAMDGCAEVLATVERMRTEHRVDDLRVTMVVPTLYRRTTLADEILAKLGSYFPDTLCKTALGYNVKIDEAQSHGRTIWEYAPSSHGAEMLEAIARELLRRGEPTQREVASA
jgi:chromosome partitioning protein